MTDDTTPDFNWGEKGEAYWRDLGQQCKASELQTRFACARYQGASATGAARLAGYVDKPGTAGIRTAGHKAIRSTAVMAILAMAGAEDKPAAGPRVLDKQARTQILSDIASKSPDKTLVLRGIEALNKMDLDASAANATNDTDCFGEWRYVREHLHNLPGGAVAIVSIWVGAGYALANLPLLHDVHQAIMREDPGYWERAVDNTELPGRQRLKDRLANPNWQREARIKLWREVGVELDPMKTVDLSFLDAAGRTTGEPIIITNQLNGKGTH